MKDGEIIDIPPQAVPEIKRQMKEQTHIFTKDWTKNVRDVKTFHKTSRLYETNDPKLIEGAARAFNEPLDDKVEFGGREYPVIRAKWVQRKITKAEWSGHYSKIPSYRRAGEDAGMVILAYRLPVHAIDYSLVSDCPKEVVDKLERSN